MISIKSLYEFYPNFDEILNLLLVDQTSKKNIIWAAKNNFSKKINSHIKLQDIVKDKKIVIKNRSSKPKNDKIFRIKEKSEVFTPSWICNKQLNFVDWKILGKKNVFNIETKNDWKTKTKKIDFSQLEITWQEYIDKRWIEISCGEGPYITSRYDVVSGEPIKLSNRFGILDRKLRIINENVFKNDEWFALCKRACKSIYGYEYQGDNLFLARLNLLLTILENYFFKFKVFPNFQQVQEIVEILSWNIFQMDGLKCTIPLSCKKKKAFFHNLLGEKFLTFQYCPGCENDNLFKHNGKYCNIKDWSENKVIEFISLVRGEKIW